MQVCDALMTSETAVAGTLARPHHRGTPALEFARALNNPSTVGGAGLVLACANKFNLELVLIP